MVTGNEYVFDNIDEALAYVLATERDALAKDSRRQKPPMIMRSFPGMFSQPFSEAVVQQAYEPVDSLDYPLAAWFNNAATEKFVMTRLQSGRYSLKPNLRNRKFLFRGESEFHNRCKPNMSRNPRFNRICSQLSIICQTDRIASIKGWDDIANLPQVIDVMPMLLEGQSVGKQGTTASMFARLHIVVDSIEDLNDVKQYIYSTLRIENERGENIIINCDNLCMV